MHDDDIHRFLKLFTDLPLERVEALSGGNANEAKKALADAARSAGLKF